MHGRFRILAMVGVVLAAGPVWAGDEADCLKGIKKLQAVKKPTGKAEGGARRRRAGADRSRLERVQAGIEEVGVFIA
jgi:hypothetical protein